MKRSAVISITKLAAAKRQLDAAIRMRFASEDELAIHSVAAAALGILRDVARNRPTSSVAELMALGLQRIAKSYLRGILDDEGKRLMEEDPTLRQMVIGLVHHIEVKGDDFDQGQYAFIGNPSDIERQFWGRVNKPANFLKHADRDADAALASNEIDCEQLIHIACGMYATVMRRLTPEMTVFLGYWIASREDWGGWEAGQNPYDIAQVFKTMKGRRRIAACRKLIRSIKTNPKTARSLGF